MMKPIRIIVALTSLLFSSGIIAQKISNVNFEQTEDNKIKVTYMLTNAKYYQKFKVDLYVSKDGGKNYIGPLLGVEGDVGENIEEGLHTIIWSPFKDVNSLEGKIVFDIEATVMEVKRPKKFFVNYQTSAALFNFNRKTPFGIQAGQLGKIGWYASARFNFEYPDEVTYNYENNEIVDYDSEQGKYYDFDDEEKYPRFSVTAGLTYQLNWHLHAYSGVGYGYKYLIWHISEFNYSNNEKTANAYVENNDEALKGIEIEAGLIYNLSFINITAGLTSLNMQHVGIVGGLGITF